MLRQLALGNMEYGCSEISKDDSRLQLTYDFDRLLALSGLASRHSGLCSATWHGCKTLSQVQTEYMHPRIRIFIQVIFNYHRHALGDGTCDCDLCRSSHDCKVDRIMESVNAVTS